MASQRKYKVVYICIYMYICVYVGTCVCVCAGICAGMYREWGILSIMFFNIYSFVYWHKEGLGLEKNLHGWIII